MFKLTKLAALMGLLTAAGVAAAADAPAAPAAPKLSQVLDASGITATGYVDAGYEYVSNTTPSYRVFDTEHSAFSLHQAALNLAYQPKTGFGAFVNFTTGDDAQLIHSVGSGDTGSFDVTQAYVQYATDTTTIIAGKFNTLAGAEVISPALNTNISRSVLFGYAVPFTHTGVRATFAATDEVSLILGVNNGWDQVRDLNTQKTAEFGVAYTTKPFVLAVSGYVGSEPTLPNINGSRQLIDVVATFNASDALSFVLNYDWGKQEDYNAAMGTAKWTGLAGYVNYAIDDSWRVSGRLEYFNDKNGFRLGAAPQKLKEATFTVAYMVEKSFEVRFEGRHDWSDKSTFMDNGIATDNQNSVAIGGIFKF